MKTLNRIKQWAGPEISRLLARQFGAGACRYFADRSLNESPGVDRPGWPLTFGALLACYCVRNLSSFLIPLYFHCQLLYFSSFSSGYRQFEPEQLI
jgi:hypothetical protein